MYQRGSVRKSCGPERVTWRRPVLRVGNGVGGADGAGAGDAVGSGIDPEARGGYGNGEVSDDGKGSSDGKGSGADGVGVAADLGSDTGPASATDSRVDPVLEDVVESGVGMRLDMHIADRNDMATGVGKGRAVRPDSAVPLPAKKRGALPFREFLDNNAGPTENMENLRRSRHSAGGAGDVGMGLDERARSSDVVAQTEGSGEQLDAEREVLRVKRRKTARLPVQFSDEDETATHDEDAARVDGLRTRGAARAVGSNRDGMSDMDSRGTISRHREDEEIVVTSDAARARMRLRRRSHSEIGSEEVSTVPRTPERPGPPDGSTLHEMEDEGLGSTRTVPRRGRGAVPVGEPSFSHPPMERDLSHVQSSEDVELWADAYAARVERLRVRCERLEKYFAHRTLP